MTGMTPNHTTRRKVDSSVIGCIMSGEIERYDVGICSITKNARGLIEVRGKSGRCLREINPRATVHYCQEMGEMINDLSAVAQKVNYEISREYDQL